MNPADLARLRSALRRHTCWGQAPLLPLRDSGLAHWHVRLEGTGLLARIPKQSQLGLDPRANLAHQQACFTRAWRSGHTPRLAAVLAVSDELPRGALLVEEIAGVPVGLPRDLDAVAAALSALHALPLPAAPGRAPLEDAPDPLEQLNSQVLGQAVHLGAARLQAEARGAIDRELDTLQGAMRRSARPQRCLIAFDAHPGNFLRRGDGRAMLVDLEKCRYSYPGLDLAHATLYTSTTWDVATSATLSVQEVADFYAAWKRGVDADLAAAAGPWHVPLRRAMWLWSITWCCKWRALADRPPSAVDAGEDWSAVHSDASLVEHVRDRVAHYLSPAVVRQVLRELCALDEWLAA